MLVPMTLSLQAQPAVLLVAVSPRAESIPAHLHAIPEPLRAIPSDWRKELRQELRAAGVFDRCEARSWGKLLILLAAAVATGSLVATGATAWSWLWLLPTAWLVTSAAMLGHEGAHKSLAADGRRNALMLHLAFPLLGGLGAHHWKWKHNQRHHAHPNVAGQDLDIQMWPMACHRAEFLAAGPRRRWFIRHAQWLAFWPLTMLMPLMMRINSWRILALRARDQGVDAAWLTDAGCLVAHYLLWLVLPAQHFGWPATLAFYFALWLLVGLFLAAIFAPAHMGMPIQTEHPDDWLAQLETSRNLTMPAALSWFFIGLDYQVEHHLFEGIAHQHLPQAARITKAWAARHGVPYHTVPFAAGLLDVTRYLRRAWSVDVLAR